MDRVEERTPSTDFPGSEDSQMMTPTGSPEQLERLPANAVEAIVPGGDIQEYIRSVIQQEIQAAIKQTTSKLTKMAVDVQFLEVCLGHRRHHGGNWLVTSSSTAQGQGQGLGGGVEDRDHRCCGRVGQLEQSLNEMVNLHWTLAKQGNDLRSHMDKMTRRIHKLETGVESTDVTSGPPSAGSKVMAMPLKSRELSLAMPIARLGGDLGPSLMTSRNEGTAGRDNETLTEVFAKGVDSSKTFEDFAKEMGLTRVADTRFDGNFNAELEQRVEHGMAWQARRERMLAGDRDVRMPIHSRPDPSAHHPMVEPVD